MQDDMQDTSPYYVELEKDPMPDVTTITTTASRSTTTSPSTKKIWCCFGGSVLSKNDKRLLQMLVLFASIILFGGFVFSLIEQPNELLRLSNVRADQAAAKTRTLALLNNNHTLFDLLAQAGAEKAFDTSINDTDHWSFLQACLFSFTVITTIGYGTFSPSTTSGQIFLVFFALVGVPAAGITLVYIADAALKCATKYYTLGRGTMLGALAVFDLSSSGSSTTLTMDEVHVAIENSGLDLTDSQMNDLMVQVDPHGLGEADQKRVAAAITHLKTEASEAGARCQRVKVVLFALVIWISFAMVVFCWLEEWSAAVGFYFAFVTLTTIGLGDFFPETVGGQFFLVLFAMIGLGMLAVLLTLVEGMLKDWKQAQKFAIERARSAAVLARSSMARSSSSLSSLEGGGKATMDGLRRASSSMGRLLRFPLASRATVETSTMVEDTTGGGGGRKRMQVQAATSSTTTATMLAIVVSLAVPVVSGYQYNYTVGCGNTPVQWTDGTNDCAAYEKQSLCKAHCTNSPVEWTDGSDDCASYAANSYCAAYGGTVGTGGLTANQACCACGGGKDAQLVGTSGLTADQACCTCGGGKDVQKLVTMVPDQFAAWQALFTTTGGKTSWTCCADKLDDPCGCDDHVTCDENGMITTLVLDSCGLQGKLPNEFSSLTGLTKLRASHNALEGNLPSLSAVCQQLTYLRLNNNKFSGSLPDDWRACVKVITLSVSDNQLSGELPVVWAEMVLLTNLYLYSNQLSGPLPADWKSMVKLTSLRLYSNQLSGTLPVAWSSMEQITRLYLYSNKLTGSLPPEWSSMSQLFDLRLFSNQLTGILPATWSSMVKLKTLHLFTNQLTGTLPTAWSSMVKLRYLFLNSNQLTGPLPADWKSMVKLTSLRLYSNQLSGTLPVAWSSMSQLTHLYLQSNQLTGTLPVAWSSMTQLTFLDLQSNQLNGTLPSEWKSFSQLQSIQLQHNNFTGTIPNAWRNMTNLVFVYFNNNQLSGEIPNFLLNTPSMQDLRLSNNKFIGAPLASLFTAPSLQNLMLQSNNFTGTITSTFGNNAPQLVTALIQDNKFTGSLPASLIKMKHLSSFIAHRNNFQGQIPEGLGNASNLTTLALAGNRLVGPIPTSLGNSKSLEMLILRANKLSGTIPSNGFASNPHLRVLDLAQNNLAGVLPPFPADHNIEKIQLSSNGLTGTTSKELLQLRNLSRLEIDRNFFSCAIPQLDNFPLPSIAYPISFQKKQPTQQM